MYKITDVNEWNACFNILLDPEVSEIASNGPDSFFVVKNGNRTKLNLDVGTEKRYSEGVEKGLIPSVTTSRPYNPHGYLFEGQLRYKADGVEVIARCHIGLAPSTKLPQVTIAKKSASLRTLESIASTGAMSTEMMNFLKLCIDAGLTTVISGGTGSGKSVHSSTRISTPFGMCEAGALDIGDTIFDENGRKTRITNKYSPNETKHYKLSFEDETNVHAGMGHLWKVTILNDNVKVNENDDVILNDEQIRNLKNIVETGRETFITFEELKALIGGQVPAAAREALNGFGTKGEDFFKFDKNSVMRKVSNSTLDEKQEILTRFENFVNDEVTLREIKELVDNNEFVSKILPTDRVSSDDLILVKKEAATHLLKDHGNRVAAKLNGTEFDNNRVKLMTTQEMVDYGVFSPEGYLNLSIEGISNSVNYETQELPESAYIVGRKLADGLISKLPEIYKYSSTEQRLELISGVMASDNGRHIGEKAFCVDFTEESMIEDLKEVVSSLGWNNSIAPYNHIDDSGSEVIHYSFSFWVNMPKKHYIKSIDLVEDANPKEYFCFEVDSPTHMFLCSDSFIPTHNTTMLESMTKLFPDHYRIAVAEDIPELVLVQPNTTYWEAVPLTPGMNPNDVATLQWVVKQFQRNRNDRIIIGETRGAEFSEFLVAANSGKNGSLTTIHADDPVSCLRKMTNFATQGFQGLNIRSVNTELASAVDIIVQLNRFPDTGRHRVTQIQEITETLGTGEDARISTQPLYTYEPVSDTFRKEENISDHLRMICRQRGIDVTEFLQSKMRESTTGHMSSGGSGAGGVTESKGPRTLGSAMDTINPVGGPTQRGGIPSSRQLPTSNPFTNRGNRKL